MATLTSTTDTAENMRAALRDGDAWKTPPDAPTERPNDLAEGEPVPLDKLEPAEYNAVRDAQEHEKKHPEPSDEAGGKKTRRSGWEKRIDKLTARTYQATARAEAAERERDELRRQLAGNGNGASHETVQIETAQPGTQDEFAPSRDDAPSASPRAELTPEQAQRYERTFAESAQRIPGFDRTLAAANQINVSDELASGIRAAVPVSEIPHVIKFLTDNPRVIEALESDPAAALANVAKLASDLKASRTPRANANAAPQATARRMEDDPRFPAHVERVRAALNSLPDGYQLYTAANAVPIREHVWDAILEMDNSSDAVALNLARHPEIVKELNSLSPTAAAARIGRMAAEAGAARNTPRRASVQPPPPITPVGASSTVFEKPLQEMPIKDFIKTRNKQERESKRRGR